MSVKVQMLLTLAVSAVTALLLGSAPALAENHPFLASFGTFTNPNGIAIDQSSGDVYVADIKAATVQKFDANGNPVNFPALGSNTLTGAPTPAKSFSFPEVPDTPAALAVDSSTSPSDPSARDLYVMDAGHKVIDKFSPTGAYLSQITGPFAGELLGLGLDTSGNVRVDVHAGLGPEPFETTVDVFDDSVTNIFITGVEVQGNLQLGSAERGFAVGPTGDALQLYSCGCMEKFGANGEKFGRVDGSSDVAAALDSATGHLYVDDQSSVSEWDTGEMNGRVPAPNSNEDASSGTPVSSFGSLLGASGQGGLAVNSASGEIYVSDPAKGTVDVFGAAAPSVAVSAPGNVTTTSATLQGTVDPRGVPVSSCVFEYGTSSSYGQSAPCAQTVAAIGSGGSPVAVSADISGLHPGLLYHFRLVAPNASGSAPSRGLFATAGPGFGIKNFEVSFLNEDGTPDIQAGSHPFKMVTNLAFNTRVLPRETTADSLYVTEPDGTVKDVIVDLPPGLVGDPNATAAKCTLKQLDTSKPGATTTEAENECPAESKVGELEVEFGDETEFGGGKDATQLLPIKEPVFNMVAPHGVAAQFAGHFITPNAFINSGVLAGGDYPVQASVIDAPALAPVVTSRLTIFGVPGSSEPRKPLLTLPTACNGPLKSTVSTDSYQHPGTHLPDGEPSLEDPNWVKANTLTHDAAGHALALTGCSQLLFPPTITVKPDVSNASSSSGLTVGVHVSQKAALNPEGLAESALRDTTVALPLGVAINPAGADGLEACSEGLAGFLGFKEFNPEFEPGDRTPTFSPDPVESLQSGVSFCPDGSKIGTVKLKTPLLANPLEGAVYLASQEANPFGSLVAMYMFIEDPVSGTVVKLTGEVQLCEFAGQVRSGVSCAGPGQIVTTFKNTPELPFEDLELHFFGGERAPLTTPSRCGTYTTQATFVPWDGNGPVNTSSPFQVTSGPNGSACPGGSLPFSPSLTAGSTNINAGSFSPFTMTMSREDGEQNLQAVSLKMPPGLSGLLSGVKLCGEAEANAGTCGPESEIGETTVSVGVGDSPFSVKGGKVYITGPYRGAPFGLSIVNPAKAGPYDLGKVIVRAKIEVDPITAALTITSDNEGPYKIPQYLKGIPLQVKHVNVTITRPGFTFNPTNCNKMEIGGSLSAVEGATSALAVPFQATNCASLAFAPKFAVSTSGKTSKANGASLNVKLTYPEAPFGSQANIARVKVDLPKQLPSRLTTLQKACTAAQFKANPAGCPAASVVGHAKAITPLIPVPLEGPAYFVSNGSEAFPNLIVVLQGYGVTIDLVGDTFISKAGITSSTFKTVPDAPVGSFELILPQGKFSALAANGNLCTSKLAMPTEFVAQNGAVIHQSTPVGVTGCAKKKALTRAQKLAAALKVCRKDKKKAKRAGCERAARKRFGAVRSKNKAKGKK